MNEILILAQIADRPCAFRASDVETVIEVQAITPIPRAPPHILGLTTLRSQALTVLDCRAIAGENPEDFSTDSRAVAVQTGAHSYALRVDEVRDVAMMASEPVQISGGFGDIWSEFAEGMAETDAGPVLVLNPAQILAFIEKMRCAA
jgi:purine-binding chemotaxis protein CheW